MNGHEPAGARKSGLPDLVNQKDGSSNDKAKKYLEDLDGVKFNDVQVPDTLKKQLEYFDREVSILPNYLIFQPPTWSPFFLLISRSCFN